MYGEKRIGRGSNARGHGTRRRARSSTWAAFRLDADQRAMEPQLDCLATPSLNSATFTGREQSDLGDPRRLDDGALTAMITGVECDQREPLLRHELVARSMRSWCLPASTTARQASAPARVALSPSWAITTVADIKDLRGGGDRRDGSLRKGAMTPRLARLVSAIEQCSRRETERASTRISG